MESAIEARLLTKKFKGMAAVSEIDLDIKPGEVFGLVGPDGAGKTTLLRLLSTAMEPTSGEARVLGLDIKKDEARIRTRIGYMPQGFNLYRDMTVDENIDFFAEVYNVPREDRDKKKKEFLEFTRLEPFRKRRAQNLSGGMYKKLALASCLIHTPELLFLDEPTTGVDPISRQEFWRILGNLAGLTVIVSTPYMDEAERCHRVGLIRDGRFLIVDTPANIKTATQTETLDQAFVKLVT